MTVSATHNVRLPGVTAEALAFRVPTVAPGINLATLTPKVAFVAADAPAPSKDAVDTWHDCTWNGNQAITPRIGNEAILGAPDIVLANGEWDAYGWLGGGDPVRFLGRLILTT